jgi:hypothetical protein
MRGMVVFIGEDWSLFSEEHCNLGICSSPVSMTADGDNWRCDECGALVRQFAFEPASAPQEDRP